MKTLKFVDTHNMVTFLSKPIESEGFEQIVDFLNAHPVKHALTVNPTIYASCIEQFWATVKAKTINGEVQLQALVDGKKIIITESTVKRDLQLEDVEATNQKFNFSKYIFKSMVKTLENVSGKFLMYPRFVQVFLDKQLEGMSNHNRIYVTPSHTKKIFGNMRRVGKGFSRRETPLFQTMVVQAQAEMGEGSANPTDPHHTPTIIQPSTSQPQKKQRPRKPKRKDTQIPQSSGPTDNVADEAVNEEMDDSLERAATTATSLDAEQDRGNEFSSTMASAIICLATNQRFNFSKYIFESMVKNLDNVGKFLMYPSGPTTNVADEVINEEMDDSLVRAAITASSLEAEQDNDEAVYKELDDSLVRAATTAFSLEVEQDSGNIIKTRSKVTPNEAGSLGTTSGGGPRRQETMEDTIAQTRFENVSKLSNDPLLARERVLDLETSKITQANEIASLKRRAKKLEHKKRSRTHRLKRINAIDADEDITLVNDQDDADKFDVNTLTALAALKSVKPKVKANVVEEPSVPVSIASTKVSAATTTTSDSIPTLRKGIVITELDTSTTTTISSHPSQAKVQDKGKGIMVEELKKMKKKDQISFDEQEAKRLQAEFDEKERLAREKDETNVALTEEWDDIQAKVDVDYQLAQRLQAEEQEKFTT
ncbi:hypothetical protein Tco_0348500 [Tanacetum coccineum]